LPYPAEYPGRLTRGVPGRVPGSLAVAVALAVDAAGEPLAVLLDGWPGSGLLLLADDGGHVLSAHPVQVQVNLLHPFDRGCRSGRAARATPWSGPLPRGRLPVGVVPAKARAWGVRAPWAGPFGLDGSAEPSCNGP